MYVENICWVYKKQPDGTNALVRISYKELKEIKERNKYAPAGERRYFAEDYYKEGRRCECINVEVSHAQYNRWHSQYRTDTRGNRAEEDAGVTLISLNLCDDKEYQAELGDAALSPSTIQEEKSTLRDALERLRDYLESHGEKRLCDLLDYYQEMRTTWGSAAYIARKYNVSLRTVSSDHAKLKKIAMRYLKDFV